MKEKFRKLSGLFAVILILLLVVAILVDYAYRAKEKELTSKENPYFNTENYRDYRRYDKSILEEITGEELRSEGTRNFGLHISDEYYVPYNAENELFQGMYFYVFDSKFEAKAAYEEYLKEDFFLSVDEYDGYAIADVDACDAFVTDGIILSKNLMIVYDYEVVGNYFSSEEEAEEAHKRAEEQADKNKARLDALLEIFD